MFLYERLLSPHRMYVFYLLRCLLGVVCAFAEVYFVKGVLREIGANVARITLCILVFRFDKQCFKGESLSTVICSAGMFVSSTAYLPSTTSMYLTLISCGAWFNRSYELAILATAISALLSWPFAVLLGVPIAYDIVFRRKRPAFFMRW